MTPCIHCIAEVALGSQLNRSIALFFPSSCMLFDTLHSLTLPQHVTLSDPYAPRTEKQIPFYKGFILVMRHGPYLTLTAAFLFITVAIQVN